MDTNMIQAVLMARAADTKNGTSTATGLIAMLAMIPNMANIGENGMPQPFGEAEVLRLVNEGQEKATKALEKATKTRERAAIAARMNALLVRAEGFPLSFEGEELATLRDIFSLAKASGYVVTLNVDGESVSLGLTEPKPEKGAKASGSGTAGKPSKDEPRPFLDMAGDRILGPLTSWAKENLSRGELAAAPHDDAGKLRGGGVIVTYLTSEHKGDNGTVYGPWIVKDDGEDFDADHAAYVAAQEKAKVDKAAAKTAKAAK